MGAKGKKAEKQIKKENPNVDSIIFVREGTDTVPNDFRCNRVFVWVNHCGIVTKAPIIG